MGPYIASPCRAMFERHRYFLWLVLRSSLISELYSLGILLHLVEWTSDKSESFLSSCSLERNSCASHFLSSTSNLVAPRRPTIMVLFLVCLCLHMCKIHVHKCSCGGQKTTWDDICQEPSTCWRLGISLAWNLPLGLGWLTNEA